MDPLGYVDYFESIRGFPIHVEPSTSSEMWSRLVMYRQKIIYK